MKHLAVCQTELSLGAFAPAEILMRVHSVGTELHNLRLWEMEGCAEIYAPVLDCVNTPRTGLFVVLWRGLWRAVLHRHIAGCCGLYCWSHNPGWHVEGAAVVLRIYTELCRSELPERVLSRSGTQSRANDIIHVKI